MGEKRKEKKKTSCTGTVTLQKLLVPEIAGPNIC
jgi:hypothetical protein